MVSVSDIIQFIYPNARPFADFVVSDVGAGPSITYWNPAIGVQPSQAELDAATAGAQAAADAAAATLAQEKLDRQELRDRFIAIRDGLNAIIGTASFTNATRDAAIIELAKDVRFLLKAVKGLM